MAEARKRRKSDDVRRANQVIRGRTVWLMAIFGVATFLLLFWKLFDLQILRHEELESKAVSQQTRSSIITASRGTIYDRGGEVLAISTTAETVNISPKDIASFVDDQEKAIEDARQKAAQKGESYTAPEVLDEDYIARGLARILGLEEAAVRKRMDRLDSGYEIIKKKAPQAEADEVRRFVNGEIDDQGSEVPEKERKKLHGVYLEPDSKRYYPNGTLAAQVIGFVNADNEGAYGLESYYNSALTGTSGMTVTAKNAAGKTMLYDYEQYYDAENGANLITTLDSTVQYYLEKGLEEMIAKFDPKNGATGIVMDVRNGAVLGMASFPTYDLNSYGSIYDTKLQATLEGLEEGGDEYLKALVAAQNKQWRNKCVNDTYEPGSTFKPVTLAAALEEGLVNLSTTFTCTGSIRVPGWSSAIGCSRRSGHGTQTLKEATGNSCNPAFITMGLKIGTETYYDYLEKFGFLESTGIDLYGESNTIFASRENFNTNVVSLASYAFGQTFNITPLHLIRAQAACVNGGYLYEPYLVEQIVDDDGSVLYQHDAAPIRQVISEETSATVRECLEYVVASGTGKNGQVVGYRIGGKTGTADKTGSRTQDNPRGDVVVSFMCFAPADDPQYILLITMDTPSRNTGVYVSGGNMAAPTASQIMGEILPHLGVEPEYSEEDLAAMDQSVPNCVGFTAAEAKAKLAERGFACRTIGSGDTVTDQTPAGGAIVPGSAAILLYLGEEKPDTPVAVPNVVGLTAAEANQRLTSAGLILKVTGATASSSGNVHAISQSVAAGTEVAAGTVITVRFSDGSVTD